MTRRLVPLALLVLAVTPLSVPRSSRAGGPESVVLDWCGFTGRLGVVVSTMAVGPDGSLYVGGWSPTRLGSPNGTSPDDPSRAYLFAARLSPDGRELQHVGSLEIDRNDRHSILAMAVDAAGYVYLAGVAPNGGLPAFVGPATTYHLWDIWVAKLKPDGSGPVYCGYIGGSEEEWVGGIAVDDQGCAYVCGGTRSDENSFPVRIGPGLRHTSPIEGRDDDGWVAKVAADGSRLEYCGYIGGRRPDSATGIVVDAQGRAVVCGWHQLYEGDISDFPVRVGPSLKHGGWGDAWVARVSTDGAGLDYCGYIGGKRDESASGIALDPAGNAYVTGTTRSTEKSFPVTVGPNRHFSGAGDAWVAKVREDGTGLIYCGYVGGREPQSDTRFGDGQDWSASIAVDGSGRAYVVGRTQSDETSFPVKTGPDLVFRCVRHPYWYNAGGEPVYPGAGFIACVQPDGAGLDYCGYLGGAAETRAARVAVDAPGNAYVLGWAFNPGGRFPTRNGPDLAGSAPKVFRTPPGHLFGGPWLAKVVRQTLPSQRGGSLIAQPAVLALKTARVGGTVRTRLQLRNPGPGRLRVSVPSLPAPFSVRPTGDLELEPGDLRHVEVAFSPGERGKWELPLTLTSSDPKQPLFVVPIRATAVAAAGGSPR